VWELGEEAEAALTDVCEEAAVLAEMILAKHFTGRTKIHDGTF